MATALLPIDLFAAQAEIAQGHFPKSHVPDVPPLKSLRRKTHARNVPAGTSKCTAYGVMTPGTGTRVRIFHSIPMSPPVVVWARSHFDVPLLWSYRREVGGVGKIRQESQNCCLVVRRFRTAKTSPPTIRLSKIWTFWRHGILRNPKIVELRHDRLASLLGESGQSGWPTRPILRPLAPYAKSRGLGRIDETYGICQTFP
jgi:hypothetical protein